MFISNHEKNQIYIKIQSLEVQVKNLQLQIKELMPKQKRPISKTAEAPWGVKLDGTPRKRPGRPIYTKPETKNEQPLSV
jgi:hypothetical protein